MTLAILTPSYAPDFDSFAVLHRSVLEFTDAAVVHYVVVPDEDLALFATIASGRMVLIGYRDLLPKSFVSTAWFAHAVARIPRAPRGARFIAVNVRRPWPPLRGWLLQQIVKLSMAMRTDCDTLLVIDSDVQLIRPVTEDAFASSTAVRFYRSPEAITAGMTRHVAWHHAARRMLGVAPDGLPPFADPIGSLISWDPEVVRQCTDRLSEVASRGWETVVSREWEFSEYVLYGEYLAEFGTPRQLSFVASSTLCHSHWDPRPLDLEGARRFVDSIDPADVALHVQSNSNTPPEIVDFIRSATR
ncbi:DUF6492 family protein [Conyzicola nivalis]|uniref:Uncharacterized protein n=1 Tax=Conyzicola nivalis TaxID=1477021 RepID=A0A916SPS9_9MICO|nr:DUF6492 family protein [Conyzicola nivalis]GGB10190.1 hypothetical protein GCM10010979_26010 [Conyzicola nivalis]